MNDTCEGAIQVNDVIKPTKNVKLSVLAQLIVYKQREGFTSTADLARAIGRSERQIIRAKAELRGDTSVT
jgi:hypothetical protein